MNGSTAEGALLLSSRKRAALAHLLELEGIDLVKPPLPASSRDAATYPLSDAQRRLWFLHQLEPESAAYKVLRAFRLGGEPDVAALERGLNDIVRRHDVLRASFVLVSGEPRQIIVPVCPVVIARIDCSQHADQQASLERLIEDEHERRFDLARPPLLRASVVRLRDGEHVLLLATHHIVCDRHSMDVFGRELAALYRAAVEGRPPDLPPLALQYTDYALWQREWLTEERLAPHLAYWRRQLATLPRLELPTEPRAASPDRRGAAELVTIPAAVTAGLQALSRRAGVTLFATLVGSFQLLLSRYAGQEDVVVGTPVANRHHHALQGVIGFFVNTVPLRGDLSGNPTFVELLGRIGQVCVEAYAHQAVPFEKLVELLQPEREAGRHPIFDVLLNFDPEPPSLQLPGLTMTAMEVREPSARFPITLYARRVTGELQLRLVYQRSLFPRDRIACMLDQYQYLLDQVVANPEARIASYSLVTPRLRGVLPDLRAPLDDPRHEPVTNEIRPWMARAPDRAAVCQDGRCWTYRELGEAARQIAGSLVRRGVQPGQVVAVTGSRSFGLVAGILGVLESGGVLLTVDPDLPVERQRVMLRESRATHLLRVALAASGGDRCLVPGVSVHLVDPGRGTFAEDEQANEGPALPDIDGEHPAYIFFTSGSTGVPRAVLGSHKGLSHFVAWERGALRLDPGARCALITGLSFDPVLRDLFLPLTSGATLCLPRAFDLERPNELLRWLARESISLIHAVPGVTQHWLSQRPSDLFLPGLRYTLFAGEPLTGALVNRWREVAPNSVLINLYGPTETTLAKCCYEIPATPRPGIQPIGWALPNSQALVLADDARPCGAGEIGEIVIRSPFRTFGCLNASDETQRLFRRNPLRDDDRDLLFHTGDVGRFDPDGCQEILGRRDRQLKIRGVRIEPDEIAAVLSRHPAVLAAVVCAHHHRAGHEILVAYVTLAPASDTTAAELRRYLAAQLPSSLVPAAVTIVARLPLNKNGKVDREALVARHPIAEAFGIPCVAPSSPLEKVLARIWREVLGVEHVGCDDNFFDLGGHSLMATQVLSRVRELLELDLPLRNLFESPTITGLVAAAGADPIALERAEKAAALLADEKALQPHLRLPVPTRAAAGHPVLSPAQRRIWFLSQLEPHGSVLNICKAVHLAGVVDDDALARALNAIAARHEILRTGFAGDEGKPSAVHHDAAPVSMRRVDLAGCAERHRQAELNTLTAAEAQAPFELSAPPLLRAVLVRLGAEDHVLLLSIHHIVADGWSMGVLFHELAHLYEAFSAGREPTLSPLRSQYSDFARWQEEALHREWMGRQLDYWKRQIGGAPVVLDLPADRRRPAVQTFQGETYSRAIAPGLSRALRQVSRREDVTLFMMLVAAFAVLLHRRSGEQDILIGTPIANRSCVDLEALIGFFVNTLVLRVDLAGDPTFRGLLARVRATTIDAYSNQDLPFDKVIEELRPERDVSRTPLFQVMLAFHNTPRPALALPGLALTLLEVETHTSKFDLTFSIADREPSLDVSVEYSTDLFERRTIERMLDELEILLSAVVEDPGRPISQLPILSERERQRLIDGWNETVAPYSAHACLHELFEWQVEKSAEAVAVIDDREQVSFARLNARANQLAHHLRSLGVGPDDVVGLCVERSVDMVVGLLGSLKAGGAYLPLDPGYPAERLAYMADAAHVRVLVTQARCRWRLPAYSGGLVSLDSDREAIQRCDCRNPRVNVRPDHAAYVVFTSGSTGAPKGICGLHRGAINRFQWMWRTYPFEPGEVCAQKTSLSFLDSLWEILGPLLQGVPVRILDDDTVKDPRRLVTALADARVTRLVLVPSLLRVLLELDGVSRLTALRYWTASGEALPADLAERFQQRLPGSTLLNLYGSSEVSADVSCCVVHANERGSCVSIGRPIDNVRLYVLDRHLQPVPIGVAGEMYIGGIALARGYIGQPGLTAESFLPDLWSPERGARMYRTGDRCRYLADAEIEYLGRADHQVKIRGVRIEPREVEAALDGHPLVEKAVVVARQEPAGTQRLVAYVAARAEDRPADTRRFEADLRGYLQGRLPPFMVPSVIAVLDRLPLTPSGKLDRRALPDPQRGTGSGERPDPLPRRATERAVAEIWSGLLGREGIGLDDNFFDLGGHSLLLMELQSRLQKRFDTTIPVVDLFRHATVGALADHLNGVRADVDVGLRVSRRAGLRKASLARRGRGAVTHD